MTRSRAVAWTTCLLVLGGPVHAQSPALDGRLMTADLLAYAGAVASDPTDDHVHGFADWFARTLDRDVRRELEAGAAPGAVVILGHDGDVVFVRGYGRVHWAPDAPPADATTLYDLASVTKAAATTLAVMILVEEGRVSLDDPIAKYLPEWPDTGSRGTITLRDLLTHRSGLPAGASFERAAGDRASAIREIASIPLTTAPGARELYSDLGPVLVAFIVEELTDEPLGRFVERRVYRPLGMNRTVFRPVERGLPLETIAPTAAATDTSRLGVVHDPMARALGGVAGNAGLFASAEDLATLASALLWERPRAVVCRETIKEFTRHDDGEARRFARGWQIPDRETIWGEVLSPAAFGHTGFTGTSFWIDPVNDLFVVLLTNRVTPGASEDGHIALRRVVHDTVQRAHLAREEAARAADWRSVDVWRGRDSCRAERGIEVLRRLGDSFWRSSIPR